MSAKDSDSLRQRETPLVMQAAGKSLSRWMINMPAMVLLTYGAFAVVYLLVISWNQPVLDIHGFRQAQTALSAYWIAQGGPLLAYQTPVVGAPWSVPFEFPLYQWLVALLSKVSTLSIDQAGRLVGTAFFVGSAVVLHRLVRRICESNTPALFAIGVMLVSPLALFWSRAVMIESTAVFLSLLFMYAVLSFYQTHARRKLWALVVVVTAVLAALVKITTFFGFAIIVAVVLLVRVSRCRDRAAWIAMFPTLTVAGIAVLSALVALKAWLSFSDAIKAQSILGGTFTSSNLGLWNYGELAQRVDPEFWGTVVFGRTLVDGLGSPWLLAGAILVVVHDRRHIGWLLLLLLGYLLPFLAFTNLHWVHNYYQYANVIFLSLTVGLALWLLARTSRSGLFAATVVAMLVCSASWAELREQFIPAIRVDHHDDRVMALAAFIHANTDTKQAIMVFGLDWSSELAYYAERWALMVPDWALVQHLVALEDRKAAFGDIPVGALVVCPTTLGDNPATGSEYRRVIAQYTVDMQAVPVADCTVYHSAL